MRIQTVNDTVDTTMDEADDYELPRRSNRLRRAPDRYGCAISYQQAARKCRSISDVKERVQLLLSSS